MTREAQRIAIAKLDGWGEQFAEVMAPDFLCDVKAIMAVIESQPKMVQEKIAKLVVAKVGDNYEGATAGDMAEALLRVKGRWTE